MTKRQPPRRLILAIALFATGQAAAQSVTTYHNGNDRHGAYVVPGLTAAAAAGMHLDRGFDGRVSGSIYAQPLFWQPAGRAGRVIVATEANVVAALDAARGTPVWQTHLPAPAPLSAFGCGNIAQEGITGTPAIDPQSGTIYLDAVTDQRPDGVRHLVYALSAETGAVRPGWPLDMQAALRVQGVAFDPTIQGQRGALLLLDGKLFITYGGRWGDCGPYRGMVVQVDPGARPAVTGHWATRAEQGGIWAQGGASSDGSSLFVTTGNTTGANAWGDGESIIRLRAGLARPAAPTDFLAPVNWRELDDQDADLGGTGAVPLTVPAASGALSRVLAFGKDGNAYLADAANLGGVGSALAVVPVSRGQIITAPAVLQTPAVTMVAFRNADGPVCHGSSLSMLRVTTGATPVAEAWCARLSGAGAPIATTSDGSADPLVWVVGAQGDGLLHGFDASTGRTVFDGGGQSMSGLRHFETILAADQRFYVAATGRIYAFAFSR